MINAKQSLKGKLIDSSNIKGTLNNAVVKEYPELEDLNVIPTSEQQIFKSEKYGYNNVTVEGVEAESLNIIPTEELQNFSGLYGNVTVEGIHTEEKEVIPNFAETDIVEVTGDNYLKKVIINKDENLIPDNIKNGVVINGIEGDALTFDDMFKFTVTDTQNFFSGNKALIKFPSIDWSMMTNVTNTFRDCTNLVDVGEIILPTRNFNAIYGQNMFLNCSKLSSNSLNNILKAFSTVTMVDWFSRNYATLKNIGLSQEQAEICTTLSNWQICVDNGWSTGY